MSRVASGASVGILGACVLGSYGYLMTRENVESYWGGLKGPLFKYWVVSALITAASFLFLMTNWIFLLDQKTTTVFDVKLERAFDFILPMLLVFLLSASAWVWITVAARRGSKSASSAVTVCLWLTALSSFGLFVFALGTRESSTKIGWKVPLATIAGFFVASHHITWDAEVWRATWKY